MSVPNRVGNQVRKQDKSKITNNGAKLPDVDGRTADARRYRDVIRQHGQDLGGDDALTEAQRSLIRRAACLQIELERMEQSFVLAEGATVKQLDAHSRISNVMMRLLVTLRLHKGRIARDVNPVPLHDYISKRDSSNGHIKPSIKHRYPRVEKAPRIRTIDHEE